MQMLNIHYPRTCYARELQGVLKGIKPRMQFHGRTKITRPFRVGVLHRGDNESQFQSIFLKYGAVVTIKIAKKEEQDYLFQEECIVTQYSA